MSCWKNWRSWLVNIYLMMHHDWIRLYYFCYKLYEVYCCSIFIFISLKDFFLIFTVSLTFEYLNNLLKVSSIFYLILLTRIDTFEDFFCVSNITSDVRWALRKLLLFARDYWLCYLVDYRNGKVYVPLCSFFRSFYLVEVLYVVLVTCSINLFFSRLGSVEKQNLIWN